MGKILCLAAAIFVFASVASAETIAGKFGVAASGGAKVSLDFDDYDNDWGYSIGGGVIYGLSDSVATDFNVLYSENRLTDHRLNRSLARTVDLALGIQYRFNSAGWVVPYLGTGVSMIIPSIRITDEFAGIEGVGNTTHTKPNYGGFLKGGLDFFVTRQIAINTEVKQTIASDSDIRANGKKIAVYCPSNITGLLGLKVYF